MSADDAVNTFDHRTRSWRKGKRLSFFASDPCNGLGQRQARIRTLLVGPWRVTVTKRRQP